MKNFLRKLNLLTSIEHFPGLLGFIIVTLMLLKMVPVESLGVPTGSWLFLLPVVACLAGIVMYLIGSVWDEVYFDRRYSRYERPRGSGILVDGKWVKRKSRPYGLLPVGYDLAKIRQHCANSLTNGEIEGIYSIARTTLRDRKQWTSMEIIAPLNLSKFLRSFLLPILVTSVYFATSGIGDVIGDQSSPLTEILISGGMIVFWFFLLCGYCQLKVVHMEEVYRKAT